MPPSSPAWICPPALSLGTFWDPTHPGYSNVSPGIDQNSMPLAPCVAIKLWAAGWVATTAWGFLGIGWWEGWDTALLAGHWLVSSCTISWAQLSSRYIAGNCIHKYIHIHTHTRISAFLFPFSSSILVNSFFYLNHKFHFVSNSLPLSTWGRASKQLCGAVLLSS